MIGIIGAMDEEVEKLKADITDAVTEVHNGLTFVTGQLNGKDVTVVRSGIGAPSVSLVTVKVHASPSLNSRPVSFFSASRVASPAAA